MNKNYYNGKYNIIKPNMSLKDEAFKIRKQDIKDIAGDVGKEAAIGFFSDLT